METQTQNPTHDTAAPAPKERIINLPPVTLFLVVGLVIFHLVRMYGLTVPQDEALVLTLAFIPMRLHDYGMVDWTPWVTLITYGTLHFGWLHLAMNMAALAAFGSAIERHLGAMRLVALLVVGTIAGALAHFACFPDGIVVLGGLSGGLSTLFAVILGLLQQFRALKPGWRGLATPVIVWVVANCVLGMIGLPGEPGLAIGWVAHLGGFLVGLVALPFLFPSYRLFAKEKSHD